MAEKTEGRTNGRDVTLADIARDTGVSVVTVSKALSGQKGMSEETRGRIIRSAEELGYRKLRKKEQEESRTIGVIVAERYVREDESFYWTLFQEFSQCALEKNCFSVLEVITPPWEDAGDLPAMITQQRVDSLLVLGAFHKEYMEKIVKEAEVPVLLLDTTLDMVPCDSIVSDNVSGGTRMTNYLLELGHRDIAFVGTLLATTSIDDRFLGYLKALMEHKVEPNRDWVIDDRDRFIGHIDPEKFIRFPEHMPTAFFCNCDRTANILVRKLRANGYRVPEDISVVGFDDYVVDEEKEIELTTYEISRHAMAEKAVHEIRHKMAEPHLTYDRVVLPGHFVERESARRIGPAVPFA